MKPPDKDWQNHFRETLKSPLVLFALACAIIAAIGAPLFALSDVIN
jgi:hypothetical protein